MMTSSALNHRGGLLGGVCTLLAVLFGCSAPPMDQAADARELGDYGLAADLYTRAALETTCPERARLFILRAEVQELDGSAQAAVESLGVAIRSCPDYTEAYWARAQRLAAAGNRDLAMQDALEIRDIHPDADALYSELAMEQAVERSVRSRAHGQIVQLRELLNPESKDRVLTDRAATQLVRRIPVPVTLKYSVQQEVRKPSVFELNWEETWSYRGDPAEDRHLLVRSLELPPLDNQLPTYFRLQMANQRLPMAFEVDRQGKVLSARWLRNGPERGMRPAMFAPELEGMLKRRRLFEPGSVGQRGPGDEWRGEDTRIVDGAPVAVTYKARAEAWVETLGIRTLKITAVLRGEGYDAEEQLWIHPSTSVPVRWVRSSRYSVASRSVLDPWEETVRAGLVSISGVN
ncbi:MAG: hypothetical protein VX498_09235 [Myxococcota bacterium]|nr:hypothetical protein [Myxococcota bacterium]